MNKNNNSYLLVKLIPNHFADPISALCLTPDFIMIGTMMGSIILYDIENQLALLLSELNSENISDISYNEDESAFLVAIGDEEIKAYKTFNITDYLFRIQLGQIDEGSFIVNNSNQEYELKQINLTEEENKYFIGKLQMSNYSVPFDFDGKYFLWVEFLSNEKRNICIADVISMIISPEEKPKKYELDINIIKHISFAKILKNNKIFFVHSNNICEIRILDDKFTLNETFVHNGEEVYAVDIYYEIDNNNNYEMNIITLDIKGNVNLYKNKKEITLFNMYNLNTIDKDYKEKQFFSMGYQYFIKSNLTYFCVSSDHGCFIIKKNK